MPTTMPASAPAQPTDRPSGPAPSAGQDAARQPAGAAVELAGRCELVPVDHGHGFRRPRRLRARTARADRPRRGGRRRGVVPLDQELSALRPGQERQRADAALRRRHGRREQPLEVTDQPVDRSRRRRGRWRTPRSRRARRRCSCEVEREIELRRRPPPAPPAAGAGPGSPGSRQERSAARTSPGTGANARGSSPAPAPRPASRTARPGARRRRAPSRAPGRAARGTQALRERSPRSTSVLTKNPISPSISTRLRPAMGEPTARSSWPLVRARRAWKPARSTMKSVAPSRRARASICRVSPAGSRTGRVAPRKLCTAGRGRSVGSSRSGGRPARCCFQ